jgi:hypothetical protein
MQEFEVTITKGGKTPRHAIERKVLGLIPAVVGQHDISDGSITIDDLYQSQPSSRHAPQLHLYLTSDQLRTETGKGRFKPSRRITIGTSNYGCIDLNNKDTRLEVVRRELKNNS